MTEKEFTREDLFEATIYFGEQVLGFKWPKKECGEKQYSDVVRCMNGPYHNADVGIVLFIHPEIRKEKGKVLADEVFYVWEKGKERTREVYRVKNPTYHSFDDSRGIPLFKKRIFVLEIGNGYVVYRDLNGNKQILNF